jgi:hypothetical protein
MIATVPETRAALVTQMDEAYAALDAWQTRLLDLKAQLLDLMGDAEEITYRGEIVAKASMVRKRGRFDRDRLRKDFPTIHDTYWQESDGFIPRLTWRPGAARRDIY